MSIAYRQLARRFLCTLNADLIFNKYSAKHHKSAEFCSLFRWKFKQWSREKVPEDMTIAQPFMTFGKRMSRAGLPFDACARRQVDHEVLTVVIFHLLKQHRLQLLFHVEIFDRFNVHIQLCSQSFRLSLCHVFLLLVKISVEFFRLARELRLFTLYRIQKFFQLNA